MADREFEAEVLAALERCRGEYVEATGVAGVMVGTHVGGHVSPETERLIRKVRKALHGLYDQGLLDVLWNCPKTQITGYRLKSRSRRRTRVFTSSQCREAVPVRPGVCRVCGCTELKACLLKVGEDHTGILYRACSWADGSRTLCTNPACVAAAKAERGDEP
jgi:hypothetical protein